jgi:hypothetical protein
MPTIVKYENYFWPHSSLTSSAVRINEKVRLLELYGTVNQKINAVNIPPSIILEGNRERRVGAVSLHPFYFHV